MDTSLSIQQRFAICHLAVPSLRTEPVAERRKRLVAMRDWIHRNRVAIQQAAHDDLRKPSMETDATEIFHVLNELKVALRELDRWTAPRKIDAPLHMFGTRAWIYPEARGVCLIISPWNYPFGLAAGPLVSALAAGNSVIIKPSEITPHVSAVIKRMCDETFDPAVVTACEGGASVSQELLALPFDHIFFTGSPTVGRLVMKAAAEHLASVTLELGGKSPAIVSDSARLGDAADRIVVGKFLNNGQTCIAPDYLLVDEKIAGKFIEMLIARTQKRFASNGDFKQSPDYGRIANEAHFDRINELLADAVKHGATIHWQGETERSARFMHPVVLTNASLDSRIMQEEIFGPVLPVIAYQNLEDALAIVNARPKALALYIFTQQKALRQRVLRETSSGTVCINDCGIQFLHHELPFGGVNNSGVGQAHGHFGFKAFSHEKPVLRQKSGYSALNPFYPPFTRRTKQLMDWFLKLF